MSTPRLTIPTKTVKSRQWEVGDIVTTGSTRWRIRSMNRSSGRVVLEAMNTTNHEGWWSTTLGKLPRRTA